ncbi:hypothetical protein JVU11DRAFT_7152 [Chiua virens]|nr:hypothetical protein JVU11DRAFT_7152 [Chiua virens]
MGTEAIVIPSSSTKLMIRTWVIWEDSRLVHILVLLAAVGHCTMLIINLSNVKSTEPNGVCSLYGVVISVLTAMCYNFLVLILFIVKLSKQSSKKSLLKERLRSQHLLYFAIATMTNIPPTIFALLGSDAMVGITSVSAATASTIALCRAVRSLLLPRTVHMCHQSDSA